ncbi:MAG TPA: hypothetical protein VLT33_05600 [Labilithrix sp.]|nr:hypothetical protein [Labilithrix sp.]
MTSPKHRAATASTAAARANEPLELHLVALAIFLPALPYLFVVRKLERDGYTRKARQFRLFATVGLVALVGLLFWVRR